MRKLQVGKTYEYDRWLFVVVAERDEFSVDALCLEGYGIHGAAGQVIEVRHNSAVGQAAWEVK